VKRTLLILLLVGMLVFAGTATANAGSRIFVTQLTGANEVPPVETKAAGLAFFHLSKDGKTLDYTVVVANIKNVVASHIHLGAKDENGPVVTFLFGPAPAGGGRTTGILAKGTITSADLIGPLEGKCLSDLVDEMRSGNTYVNVHTDDGVAPPNTGPGDFPAGEIRGQIR